MRYVVVTLIGGGIALLLGVLVGGICGTLFFHPMFIPGWFVGTVYGAVIASPIGALIGLIYAAATPSDLQRSNDASAAEEAQTVEAPTEANDATFGDG